MSSGDSRRVRGLGGFVGQVVVVTGASSGIGHEAALAFARRGARVLAVARREERLAALVERCRAHSTESAYLAGDLGERAFAESVIDEAVRRYGRLDVLVNNAAVPCHMPLYDVSADAAEQVMRTNFFSCLWLTFAAIPHMLRQGSGHVVNVSSFASLLVPPYETIYAASKCAMNGFTEGLANDLAGSGIHVSLIHPGPIETEIWAKLQRATGFSGRKYPPSVVVDGIFRAIEKQIHEMVVPRRSLMLTLARWTRFLAPRIARAGAARMDPISPELIGLARERARAGKRLGET